MKNPSPPGDEPPIATHVGAYHEAGHVVLALSLGRSVLAVDIERDDQRGGQALTTNDGAVLAKIRAGEGESLTLEERASLESEVLIFLAGDAAARISVEELLELWRREQYAEDPEGWAEARHALEEVYEIEKNLVLTAERDMMAAILLLKAVYGNDWGKAFAWAQRRATDLAHGNWRAVEAVASHLMRRRRLDGDAAEKIAREAGILVGEAETIPDRYLGVREYRAARARLRRKKKRLAATQAPG